MEDQGKFSNLKNTKNEINFTKLKNQQKNVFDWNLNENQFWRSKSQLSEPPRTLKHQKTVCQQWRVVKTVPKSKNILTFFQFYCAGTDHLTWPIDRARSQLSRTFFLDSLRSILRPKRPHLYWIIFFAFSVFLLIFFIFVHFLLQFWKFCSLNPPRAPL